MHRVGRKVQFTWPNHGTELKLDLREDRRVGERGEYTSPSRINEPRHIDNPGKAIGKRDAQPEPRKGFDFRYSPRRPWRNFRRYGSGRIFSGA
jgi:hypothetical protein